MKNLDRKKHWDNIFEKKSDKEVSWYQEKPIESLQIIESLKLNKNATIIDVGCGSGLLPLNLLQLGFQNIHALDISEKAIERSKKRLADKAKMIEWIVADITTFQPTNKYDCWHDRAAFHFLTQKDDIDKYVALTRNAIKKNGYMIIGAFSDKGPKMCSGLPIKQYSSQSMSKLFSPYFDIMDIRFIQHITPFNTEQSFIFGIFQRK